MTYSENIPKISAAQLFCLLMLSRISAEIVYPRCGAGYGGETLLAIIIAEVLRFILGLPVIIYSFKSSSFYNALWRKNRFLGWFSAIGAALILVGAAGRTLSSVCVFSGRNLLLGAPIYIMVGFSAAFAIYSAFMGAEALARSGVLFLVAAAIITVIVMLADIPYMKAEGIIPPQRAAYANFAEDIIERFLRGGDYLVFAALLPFVRVKKVTTGQTVLYFALFSALAAVLLCGFYSLTLREVYGLVEFPFISAASLSDIVLFKRLDGVGAAIWALCGTFRAGLMLFCAWAVFGELKPRKSPANYPAKEGAT